MYDMYMYVCVYIYIYIHIYFPGRGSIRYTHRTRNLLGWLRLVWLKITKLH